MLLLSLELGDKNVRCVRLELFQLAEQITDIRLELLDQRFLVYQLSLHLLLDALLFFLVLFQCFGDHIDFSSSILAQKFILLLQTLVLGFKLFESFFRRLIIHLLLLLLLLLGVFRFFFSQHKDVFTTRQW